MSGDPTVDTLMAYVNANPDNPETSEQPAETDNPEPKKLILGKYESEEKALEGMHNLIQTLSSRTDEASRLARENVELKSQLASRTENNNVTDPLAGIKDDEPMTKETFLKAVEIIAERKATEKTKPVMDALGSAMEIGQAEQSMLNEHGNQYYTDMPKLREFIQATPKVRELVDRAEKNGQPLLARQYAYAEFQREQAKQVDADLQRKGAERKESVDTAKRDSTILGTDRRNTGQSSVNEKPRMSREDAAAIVDDVRHGRFERFDKVFSVKGIPSEEDLRRISGWQ